MVANFSPLAHRARSNGGASSDWLAGAAPKGKARPGGLEVVVTDVGGTHARFAIAEIGASGAVHLGETTTLRAADYPSIEAAWAAYASACGRPLPRAAAMAIACPTDGPLLKLTNNHWVIEPAAVSTTLGLEHFLVLNDLAAIGHAMAQVPAGDLVHLCGPDVPLPEQGVISVVGLGTGLGVAHMVRHNGETIVSATEGGHIDFAPLDSFEDALLARLRGQFGRVSVERVVSGPGLVSIYQTLADAEGGGVEWASDGDLWAAALTGKDKLAAKAFSRFCLALGSVAGDIALVHGASSVIIAGGLARRIEQGLDRAQFRERFTAKGRFAGLMEGISVNLVTHAQPGLLGAAAAFATSERSGSGTSGD